MHNLCFSSHSLTPHRGQAASAAFTDAITQLHTEVKQHLPHSLTQSRSSTRQLTAQQCRCTVTLAGLLICTMLDSALAPGQLRGKCGVVVATFLRIHSTFSAVFGQLRDGYSLCRGCAPVRTAACLVLCRLHKGCCHCFGAERVET